jgi:radical SAM superfamily enzyme with C-terminal helix-hairpin-helix motif
MRIAIIDGYVDEPSCLGVPPFISPYPRYIYGMLKSFKLNARYITVDELRSNPKLQKDISEFNLLIIIAGAIVPGKYLRAKPMSMDEIRFLPHKTEKVIVGPVSLEVTKNIKNSTVLGFPFECELHDFLKKFLKYDARFSLDDFAVLGAEVVRKHPDFPGIICEIETYRGCYWRKCSFCMERIHGEPVMRSPKNVLREIEALYCWGVRHFRIGRQTDFFTYMADFSREIPEPNPEFMLNFHREIWRRCPKIKTLHLDNVNPKTISEYPEESRKIIKTIVLYQTPGNVAAMGLESADEGVIRKNSLAALPEEVFFAIEEINVYGRCAGYNGLPYFLPGLNFVIGLKGEKRETFDKNFNFLKRILESGLLLRRTNIRQVKILKGSAMENYRIKKSGRRFNEFKKRVRQEIDHIMLRKIAPIGRKLTDLQCELHKGKVTFARQLTTYPLLVGIIGRYKIRQFLDVRVIGHGKRSITALEYPIDINTAEINQIGSIPGIGKRTSSMIIASRPFTDGDIEKLIKEPGLRIFFTAN